LGNAGAVVILVVVVVIEIENWPNAADENEDELADLTREKRGFWETFLYLKHDPYYLGLPNLGKSLKLLR